MKPVTLPPVGAPRRKYSPRLVAQLVGALLFTLVAVPDATAAETSDKVVEGKSPIVILVEQGKYGSAAFRCDRALKGAKDAGTELPEDIIKVCAQANLKLGDKLANVKSYREAMKRWRNAGKLDVSLYDDPDFAKRLETGLAPSAPAGTRGPPVKVLHSPKTTTTAPRTTRRRTVRRRPKPQPKKPAKPEWPSGEKGPRAGRVIGVGLSGGWDGILTLSLAWMHAERVSVEIATGIFFRTLDTRVKVYGLKEMLTPFIGVGMLTPFGPREKNASGGQRVLPRFGLDIPAYGNLYAVGQMFHVDVGLSLAVWKMEISGGASFYTSFDQDDPNRLLFFPQFGAQVMFYFP